MLANSVGSWSAACITLETSRIHTTLPFSSAQKRSDDTWRSLEMKSPRAGIAIGIFLLAPVISAQNPKAQEDKPPRLIDSIQGSKLYGAYCAVCHGRDAKGSGPMASSLKKAPSDLTRI